MPSISFGDSPLSGFLALLPRSGPSAWRYAVDLDADGRPDEAGIVDHGVDLSYHFDAPGIHRLSGELSRGDAREAFERFVVVNDPSAFKILISRSVPGRDALLADDRNGVFYTSTDSTLFEIDQATLDVTRRLELPANTTQLALAPDGRKLFAGQGALLAVIDLTTFTLRQFASAQGHVASFLPVEADRVLASTPDRLLRLDTATSTVEAEVPLQATRSLARSSDGSMIVAATTDFRTSSIVLIDAQTLTTRWSLSFDARSVLPGSISFSPRGNRVYLIDRGPERRFIVVDTSTGQLLRETTIARTCGPGNCHFSNFLSSSAIIDDRFVVFPTELGAYFVDSETDLVRFRIVTTFGESESQTCCLVGASFERAVLLGGGRISVLERAPRP